MFLLGLGNPGRRYDGTRHNLGFELVGHFAARHGAKWTHEHATYDAARLEFESSEMILVRPKTYMNRSGRAIRFLGEVEALDPAELVVLADDIALPLGQLRLRGQGSDGGHNGLRSIIEALQTPVFTRLRMGVGPVPEGVDPADFVLDPFLPEEEANVDEMLHRGMDCLVDLLRYGLERAMGDYNKPLSTGRND
jgi:PTH1 family peptidyl-tRNA hydrolase